MHNPTLITTVITPASTYDLITLSTLKTLLDISDTSEDSYLTLLISQVSAKASQKCNRVFPAETVLDRFWPARDGYPVALRGTAPPVQLTRWPVQSITSVIETVSNAPSPLTVDVDYVRDDINGRLYRLDANGYPVKWLVREVAVTYSGGLPSIPPDVNGAIATWIQQIRAARTRDPVLRSERLPGVYEASYAVGGVPMPIEVSDVLDNYTVPLVG